ncbi:plasma protein isoform X2 [Tasmannia lanceolata]|uniref:plasma protein isoform X2 n=1 Tax=Tasmannia lanceolata TaxID=3420 RepID=UPI0040632267
MWLQILCGLVIFRCFRSFFFDDDEAVQIESSDSHIIFLVADRLEKLYGGKVYTGLRIPDADTGTRQTIDMVLVTKGEAMVIAVRNFSGFVDVDTDGSWVCTGEKRHKGERHPDPVVETKRQVAILESYLEHRGVILHEGYLTGRVLLPNPNCRTMHSINFLPEVISFDKWTQLKPEQKGGLSSWIKDAFRAGKSEKMDGIYQKLNFILSTAPMWDRLEFKGKSILGEFVEFKGNTEDMQALRNVKRSKVSRLIIQKSTMFKLDQKSKCCMLLVIIEVKEHLFPNGMKQR